MRGANHQWLREQTLISAAPNAGGESWLCPRRALGVKVWGKISILLRRQKSQADGGTGSAWLTHTKPFQSQDFPLQTLSKHRRSGRIQFIPNGFCRLSFCCAAFLESKQKSLSCQIIKTSDKDLILNVGCDYLFYSFFFFP